MIWAKISKAILSVAKEAITFVIIMAVLAGIFFAFRSRCSKKVTPKPPPAAQLPQQTWTPIFGSSQGHTTIKIPIRRRVAKDTVSTQLDDTIYVDIGQEINTPIVVTPESLVGHITVYNARPALFRVKPSVSLYGGFNGGLTAGAAIDIIEVWKLSFGANTGLRNIGAGGGIPLGVDVGAHTTFNFNKHLGLIVGRTWGGIKTETADPRWMVGVSIKLIGG